MIISGISFWEKRLLFLPILYQVNHDQCERLYSKAMEYANLNKNETLLDLYCGVGTIGLTMAGSVKKLIGVEIIERLLKMQR